MSTGFCANCGRPAKVLLGFSESGGALAITHGLTRPWCEVCILEKQVAHAEERAEALPDLRERLEAARYAARLLAVQPASREDTE